MKLKFTKEQAEKVIKAYYKMYYEKEVEVTPVVSKGSTDLFETACTNVKMKILSSIDILDESVAVEMSLQENEVTNIFQVMLGEQGYEVSSISYDAGTSSGDRFNISSSYFHGINVEVKQSFKEKVKTI